MLPNVKGQRSRSLCHKHTNCTDTEEALCFYAPLISNYGEKHELVFWSQTYLLMHYSSIILLHALLGENTYFKAISAIKYQINRHVYLSLALCLKFPQNIRAYFYPLYRILKTFLKKLVVVVVVVQFSAKCRNKLKK